MKKKIAFVTIAVVFIGITWNVKKTEVQLSEAHAQVIEQSQQGEQEEQEQTEQENQEEEKNQEQTEQENQEEQQEQTISSVIGSGENLSYVSDAKEVSNKLLSYDFYHEKEKVVYLTFDDGVSTTVTPKILDILEQEDVNATFFLIGSVLEKGGERVNDIVRRMYADGNSIGNHSYSHNYKELYPNRELDLDSYISDMEKVDKILKEILGDDFSTRLVRCPGGFMSWKGMKELNNYFEENNKVSVDWNALTKDAEGGKKTAKELVANAKESSEGKDMVVLLMHDTYGKEETVKALPEIIRYYKEAGYTFKTLA